MKKEPVEFIFIIDKSTAMRGLEDVVVSEFNAMLREQQDMKGEALITTVLFDDRYELFHDRIDIHAAAPLSSEDYKTQGKAALFDAIGKSMHKLRRVRHGTKEDCRGERTVFIIITGSGDRASRGYTEEMIRKRIVYRRKEYGWEFVFFGTNMDAAAEGGKIGIAAELAQGCGADAAGIRAAYTDASSLLAVCRGDGDARESGSDIAKRYAESLCSKFREWEKDTILTHRSGWSVCSFRDGYKGIEDSAIKTLRKHLGNDIVITKWTEAEGERELEEEELFEGEISASIFTMGSYMVRYAECLYADHFCGYGGTYTYYEQRVPAGQDIIAAYRDRKKQETAGRSLSTTTTGRTLSTTTISSFLLREKERARIAKEVSVLRRSGNQAAADCWQNICAAAQGVRCSESIDYICTVRRGDTLPEGQAALFVCHRFLGDSFTKETWYKITPDGKVEEYCIGGAYGGDDTTVWEL